MKVRLAGVLAGLLVTWALWRALATTAPVAEPAASTGPAASPSSAASIALPRPASAGPAQAGRLAVAAASAVAQPASAGHADASMAKPSSRDFGVAVWELCGVGRVPVPPGAGASGAKGPAELPAHLGEDAHAAARQHLLAALDGGGLRARAAAAIWRNMWRAKPEGNPELQALARGDADPVVVAWALAQCDGRERCAGLSARDWVRLEPDNAAAWAMLLERGKAAPPDVLDGLARARRHDLHYGALAAAAQAAMPPGIAPYIQQSLLVEAFGVQAALGLPPMQPLADLCRPAAPQGSRARGVCEAMARVLADHSDTLLGLRIGLRLGAFAGWPKSELARRRAEADALSFDALLLNPEQPHDCASVARVHTWAADVARLGELGALRQRAKAASGVPQR